MRTVTSFGLIALFALGGCSGSSALTGDENVEYYYPVARQLPPEPVYSRLTWSYLPQPIPAETNKKAPYISPVIRFEMADSSLIEATQALSQTLGYDFSVPAGLSGRKISMKMVGTPEQILVEIGRQAKVETRLDIEKRTVLVLDKNLAPKLP